MNLSLLETYDRWAEVYPPVPHNPLMEVEQRSLLSLVANFSGMDVLDLACGSGRYGELARSAGARAVVGLDLSRAMLARAALPLRVRGDLTCLPFRDTAFDLVISGLALGHASDLCACAGEIARVLRPSGVLLYSDFHDEAWQAGLTRSFRDAEGKTVTLPRDGYSASRHRDALGQAGFDIEELHELRVGIEFDPVFPGCAQLYSRHHGVPLLLVVRARKSS